MAITLTPSQVKALAFDNHIILTANAGSGKTATLTQRMIKIMREMEPFDIHSVVAITFTELAASELFHKVQTFVDSEITTLLPDAPEMERLFEIKSSLVNANISTIHSFCLNLLKEFPLEADIDANIQIIDRFTQDEFVTASIRKVLNRWFEDPDKKLRLKKIMRVFLDKNNLIGALSSGINTRYVLSADVFTSIENEDTNAIRKVHELYFGKIFSLLVDSKEIEFLTHLAEENYKVTGVPQDNNPFGFIKFLRDNREIIFTAKNELRAFKKGLKDKYDSAVIAALLPKIKPLLTSDGQITSTELIDFNVGFYKLLKDVIDEYNERKRSRSYLDFEDMQLLTRELLKNENVLKVLAARFKYILVDEYQDTNDLQYSIIIPLLEGLTRNNLFVVGDDKQSIYGFRGADLAVFNRTRDEIKDKNPEGDLSLKETFRMTPELCGFVNKLFRSVFSGATREFNEVPFKETIAGIKQREIEESKIEVIRTPPEQKQAEILVNRLISFYLQYKEKGVSFRDIAILVNKNSDLLPLRRALAAKNVPFNTIGGSGFFKTQVVLDFLNYLEFLVFPESDTALTGLLRSPFFNYSDEELLILLSERKVSVYEQLKEKALNIDKVAATVNTLAAMRSFARNSRPFDILQKIAAENEYLKIMAARQNGEQIIADFNKLLDVSFLYSSTGIRNLPEYVRFIKNAYSKDNDETNADISEGKDAVRVMTIHKAKGLQYTAVFIYNSGDNSSNDKSTIYFDKDLGFISKIRSEDDIVEKKTNLTVAYYNYVRKRKELAEYNRKFYVALTRASNFLFLFYEIKRNQNLPASFVGRIYEVFGEDVPSGLEEVVTVYTPAEEPANKDMQLTIPLEYKTGVVEEFLPEEEPEDELKIPDNDLTVIPRFSTAQSFSSSHYTSYSSCPVKFYIQYRASIGQLLEGAIIPEEDEAIDDTSENEFSANNVSTDSAFPKITGNKYGTMIHNLLSVDNFNSLDDQYKASKIDVYLDQDNLSEGEKQQMLARMDQALRYVAESSYLNVPGIQRKHNEMQLLTRFEGVIIEGRLDLVIETDECTLVADYKTNTVTEQSVDATARSYRPQMDLYAWMISRTVNQNNPKKIKIYLHFLQINKECIFEYDSAQIQNIEQKVAAMIKDMRNNSFIKEPSHCPFCPYSPDKSRCIIPDTLFQAKSDV